MSSRHLSPDPAVRGCRSKRHDGSRDKHRDDNVSIEERRDAIAGGVRQGQGCQVFPDRVRRSVRHHAGEDRAGDRHRHGRQGRCWLRRLCRVAGPHTGPSRHAGDARSRHIDPAALEVRDRLGHRRSGDGRQTARAEPPPGLEARRRGRGQRRLRDEDGGRVRILSDRARRLGHLRRCRHASQTLLRPAGLDASLRGDQGNLRWHDRARLEPLSERPRGRERPVRDELGVRHLPQDGRQARLLQVHGQVDRREARAARHLHAQAVPEPDRQRLPRPRLAVEHGHGQERVRGCEGQARAVARRPIISSAG